MKISDVNNSLDNYTLVNVFAPNYQRKFSTLKKKKKILLIHEGCMCIEEIITSVLSC